MKESPPPLSNEYIVGFVDGEGCFDLQFRHDTKVVAGIPRDYYRWSAQFAIHLRHDEAPLLRTMQDYLGCGTIHSSTSYARYSVQDIATLWGVITPFFQSTPLRGKKRYDFELWAEAIEILYRNKGKYRRSSWTRRDFTRLIDIHEEMKPYKAVRSKEVKWIEQARQFARELPQ